MKGLSLLFLNTVVTVGVQQLRLNVNLILFVVEILVVFNVVINNSSTVFLR